MVRINRLAAPITALGPGVRVGLWVQGCTIGCAGCASTDTWSPAGGVERDIAEVASEIVALAAQTHADGLTISGGEPFQQPEELAQLVEEVRSQWPGPQAVDVLIFTGYAEAAARRRSPALWAQADIIVAGPYRHDRPSAHPLLASDNQTLELNTALGRARMAGPSADRVHLQISADDTTLTLAGLPQPGDLDRLRQELERRGVYFADVSWGSNE